MTAIRAVTLDYWDTLYDSAAHPERKSLRWAALRRLLADLGLTVTDAEFEAHNRAAAAEAERWWFEEARGYTIQDRIRWMLRRLGVERPADCDHVAAAAAAVDDAIVRYPPPLLPGAADLVRALAERFPLAIISDTGFTSGAAQDRILAGDGLLDHFAARVYSCDLGHAKPRPEPFRAALGALGVAPGEALHVGDIERTDVKGALGVGMRAVRLDVVRPGGESAAEHVARSLEELRDYLVK